MHLAQPKPQISVYFDDSRFSADEILLFLQFVADAYRDHGGLGLTVVGGKSLVSEPEVVT